MTALGHSRATRSTLAGLALAGCLHLRPPSAEVVERTDARVKRGEYVVQHVSHCLGCHSARDWSRLTGPVKPGTEGSGGEVFEAASGMPGVVVPSNITPDPETGLGTWTDGEIMRAVREGVDKDNHGLFPFMPYTYYRSMSDADVEAVVAYLRTLPSIKRVSPPTRIDFPVSVFIKLAPKPLAGPVPQPDDAQDHLAYGKYLVELGACRECHSPHDSKGRVIADRAYTGGWEIRVPAGWRNVAPNLTPDPEAYLGKAPRAEFLTRFKTYGALPFAGLPRGKGSNTLMPWVAFGGMTEPDLGAIYDYLKALAPIPNTIPTAYPDGAPVQVSSGG